MKTPRQLLARSLERFEAVAARMREVYGLRLPRHIAVWDAFWRSLTRGEQRGLGELGFAPAGIMTWFEDGGLRRRPRDGLDPRLDMRFQSDPPELVTVMSGNTDGLHFGLWYDDPAELPSFIASNYARDSAEMSEDDVTVIRVLERAIDTSIDEPDYEDEEPPDLAYELRDRLKPWRKHDDAALAADGPRRWAKAKRGDILGGLAPALPRDAGDPRATYAQYQARDKAYRARGRAAKKVLDEARSELAAGKPAFALVVGRELHWLAAADYREASLELLAGAYTALGRYRLADTARVHHAHRDLPNVGVL